MKYLNLDRTGYDKCTCARCYDPASACRVLRKRSSRNGNLSGNCRKQTGCFVIGVVGRFAPSSSVKGDRKVAEARIKRIRYGQRISSFCGSISGILNQERIGQCTVFCYRNRTDGFVMDRTGSLSASTVSSTVIGVIPPPVIVAVLVISDATALGAYSLMQLHIRSLHFR